MTRPDTFIIQLKRVKTNLREQIRHCQQTLSLLQEIQADVNYDDAITGLEKDNIDNLIVLISSGLEQLHNIVWE